MLANNNKNMLANNNRNICDKYEQNSSRINRKASLWPSKMSWYPFIWRRANQKGKNNSIQLLHVFLTQAMNVV